jgi:predicted negative regulator of RcsB-dependent stress response
MKTLLLILWFSSLAFAADAPKVQWTARDATGKDIIVPVADRPTVIAFLRAGQDQSGDAVAAIRDVTSKLPAVQIIVAFSGPNSADATSQFVQKQKITWPVVLDGDYAASGKMSVHAWPTTIIVAADGTQVAHLGGMSQTFQTDLAAYLDFAAGKIDRAALDQRLTTRQVVEDTPQQAATRQYSAATRSLERGKLDQAKAEIEAGLKAVPNDPGLLLMLARVQIKSSQPTKALALLDQLKDSAPAWQLNLLRAEAMISLDRWDDAKLAVGEAVKLNPNPSSAYYLTGLVLAHDKDWEHAADAFKKAYEATATAPKP